MRRQLRLASELQEAGRLQEAGQARGQADALLVDLTARLTRRFDRYARAYLPEGSRDTIQEAIRQMFVLFCERMYDLSTGQWLWEERFNFCFKRMAIDAIRNIQSQNELRLDGSPMAPGGGTLVSLDAPEEPGDDAADRPSLAECVADPAAAAGFRSVLGEQVAEQLMAQLPRQHAQIFTDRMNGVSWEETADRAGVSVSTAQNRYNNARARLLEILSRRDWEEALR
jgi:DNA-directed RNA polymerase specialized sigma24 family protein